MIKRILDFLFACILLLLFLIPLLILAILIKLTSPGPVLYWSKRVGKNNVLFKMPKLRSMEISTPQKATHLLINAQDYLTPIGGFIRKYSLDELPQLYSIIIGDMSFIGPRPALFNQYDLINLRNQKKISGSTPGLTGWAQVMGRDSLSIQEKVDLEFFYYNNKTLILDLKIIFKSFKAVLNKLDVKH